MIVRILNRINILKIFFLSQQSHIFIVISYRSTQTAHISRKEHQNYSYLQLLQAKLFKTRVIYLISLLTRSYFTQAVSFF